MIVTFEGAEKLFEHFDDLLTSYPHETVVAVTEDVYKNAKQNIIPHTKSTRLEQNLDMRVHKADLSGEVYILNRGMMVRWRGKPTNYALFVHFGTKDHQVSPKNKKALRWAGPNGFAFSKGHKVKGIKADPFMTNALAKTFKDLDKIFTRTYDGLR